MAACRPMSASSSGRCTSRRCGRWPRPASSASCCFSSRRGSARNRASIDDYLRELRERIEQPEVWNFEVGARSGIWAVPVDVDAVRGCPVLVDFDEDGGGEAEQGIAVGEDADLAGAAFDLLLDRPLDGVGGTHAPPVLLRQGEDGEAFG